MRCSLARNWRAFSESPAQPGFVGRYRAAIPVAGVLG